VAASIAAKLHLDSYYARLLPQQKVEKIEELMNSNISSETVTTMFVGDGINDAPVLARADIGAAVGSATDAAVESSDMVIMGNDLRKISTVIQLSRRTAAIVRQNIALTLGLKLIIMSLAVVGIGGIWQAVFADVGVSLLAVLNALRLLRHRAL
jgi:Cd2+/Zn2+-exporting ATPase